MKTNLIPCGLMMIGLLGAVPAAHAALITFNGVDSDVGVGSPIPNADAARAQFIAAAGLTLLDTLESVPNGPMPIDIGNGITVSGSSGLSLIINNDNTLPYFGFNTTPGGQNFISTAMGSTGAIIFTFDHPVTAFGGNIAGLFNDASATYTIDGDGAQTNGIPNLPSSSSNPSAVQFFGVVSSDAFTTFTLDINQSSNPNYYVGLDDLALSARGEALPQSAAPEPSSLALIGGGFLVVALVRRRQAKM